MAVREMKGAAVAAKVHRYPLIIIGSDQVARIASEGERVSRAISLQMARAAVPVECGNAIPVAPARGPMMKFTPREVVRTDTVGFAFKKSGYEGRAGARVADAFDLMTLQAYRQHPRAVAAALAAHPARVAAMRAAHDSRQEERIAAGGRRRAFVEPDFVPPKFVAPFTNGQVQMARAYAALSERVAGSGIKCSSLEAVTGSGGGGGDREAAVLRDIAQLRALHRRIGNGLAKEVRRIRPDGVKRRAIYARRLVDMVCLGDMTLKGVLDAHGWAWNERSSKALRVALCSALDRMQGYDAP